MGALESSLTPSGEEEDVQKKLSNLMASRDLGLVQAEEQAVPLQAILGEQGRITRRAEAGAIPLQTQLALLQARRQAAADVAKTRYGVEKDIYGMEKDMEKEQRPDEEKISEFTNDKGEQVVAFRNNKTGVVRQEVLGAVAAAKTSASERQTQMKTSAISVARPLLLKAKGGNQYVDTDTYMNLRNQYAEAIGNPLDFDRVFASYLSPEERQRLGVGRTAAGDIGDLLAGFLAGGSE